MTLADAARTVLDLAVEAGDIDESHAARALGIITANIAAAGHPMDVDMPDAEVNRIIDALADTDGLFAVPYAA